MDLNQHPHRRLNILTNEWILVSPHRTKRPWQGQKSKVQREKLVEYDSNCYLCPGNNRVQGEKNPQYQDTFSFVNDFSALYSDMPHDSINENNLIRAESEKGICKVICFSPRHDLTLALMDEQDIVKVIKLWINEYRAIGSHENINYVQIFENRGAEMGCSNPHPHCQIWANQSIPELPKKESFFQKDYFERNNKCLLCDYLELEIKKQERIVIANDSFIVLVPFWAVWPYEVMLVPKKHHQSISQLDEQEVNDLAVIMKRLGIRYDNLFECGFPYSMGIHQQPTDSNNYPEWHCHFHYYPPLLRSATIKKFMVGYEMLASSQRDITPEYAADVLRKLSDRHYTKEG